jgi:hypothetical protein
MNTRLLSALCAALTLCGCRGLPPFPPLPQTPLDAEPAALARERFAQALPSAFSVLNSVVFEYRGHSLAGLGCLSADSRSNAFNLACLTPMGVTLFEIKAGGGRVESRFAVKALARYPRFTDAVAADVRRAFFDLVPTATATGRREPWAIVFAQPAPGGRVEYVFGGAGARLVAKRYFEGKRLVCQIGYFDYREAEGKLFAQRIVLQNLKYRYGLTVKLREIRRVE